MRNGRIRVMLAHHRGPYKQSLVLALAILLALFVFFPPFEFTPYELQAEEPPTVVEIVQDVVIPPPPKEPSPPPPVIEPGDPVDDDPVIPPNVPGDPGELRYVKPHWPGAGTGFIPFDSPPVAEYTVRPEYPQLAREAGIEGTVTLKVRVGLDHKVHQAIVLTSDVTPAMERAAIAAALQCRYKPARQGSVEVEVWVAIRIEFRLN